MRITTVSGRTRTLAAIAFAAAAGVGGTARANLIVDGGFETPVVPNASYTVFPSGGSFGGWTVDCPNCSSPGNVAVVSTNFAQGGFDFVSHSGSQWLDLTGTANQMSRIYQSFATTNGATYSLSFWIGNVVDQSGVFGVSSTVGVSESVPLSIPLIHTYTNANGAGAQQQWTQVTTTFKALADSTTIFFYNFDSSTDNSNGLDDVDVEFVGGSTSVPEPAPLALLGAGLVAVVASRRSRR